MIWRSGPLLVLTCLAFGLLLAAADNPWLGIDGGLVLAVSRQEVGDILAVWARDSHPPLYYLLLHYWMELAGTGGFVAKFPGLAAALLAVPMAYQWGRCVGRGGRGGLGLWTAYIVVISISHVVLGVSLRDFALGVTLSLTSLYTFVRALRPGASPWRWGAYVASTAAALYTFYFAVPLIAAQGLYLLLSRNHQWNIRPWAGAMVGIAAVYVPWLWLAAQALWERLRQGPSWPDPVAHPLLVDPEAGFVFRALRWLTSSDATGAPTGFVVIGVAVLMSLGWVRRQHVKILHARLLLIGFAATLGFAYGGARWWVDYEESVERYVYTVLPFYAPLAAFCLQAIGRAHRAILVILLVAATVPFVRSLQLFLRPGPGSPAAELRTYLEQHASTQDLLLFTFPQQAGEFASSAHDSWDWRLIPSSGFRFPVVYDVERRVAALLAESASYRSLWLVLWDDDPRNLPVADTLAATAYPAGSGWAGATYVAPYLWPAALPPRPVGALFLGDIELAAAAFERRATPGGVLRVILLWRGDAPPANYRAFVHFLDERGRRWAQHDGEPVAGLRPTPAWHPGEVIEDRHGLLVPTSMPPGEYWLEVGLSGGGQRLHLQAGGNSIRLGPIHVALGDEPEA